MNFFIQQVVELLLVLFEIKNLLINRLKLMAPQLFILSQVNHSASFFDSDVISSKLNSNGVSNLLKC